MYTSMIGSIFCLSLLTVCLRVEGYPVELDSRNDTTLGGIDDVQVCGGSGTYGQLRISGCDGVCNFHPGTLYNTELDFTPGEPSSGLTLRLQLCYNGYDSCFQILDGYRLIPPTVVPGSVHNANWPFVPNDLLVDMPGWSFKAMLYDSISERLAICISAPFVVRW